MLRSRASSTTRKFGTSIACEYGDSYIRVRALMTFALFARQLGRSARTRVLRGSISTRVHQVDNSRGGDGRNRRSLTHRSLRDRRSRLPVRLAILCASSPPSPTSKSSRLSHSTPRRAPAPTTPTFASFAIANRMCRRASSASQASPTTRRTGSAFAHSSAAHGASRPAAI